MKLHSLRTALCAVADIALPRRCIVCSTLLSVQEKHLCVHCLADLPRTHFSSQPRNQMADRFNALVSRDLAGAGEYVAYSYASALFFYRSSTGYSLITQRLKYHSDISAGEYFSRMLGRDLAEAPHFADVDAIIPVPLHWTRRWSRGYNQAEVIAGSLAEILGAVLRTDILERRRRTRTQTKVSVELKAANVAGAFKVRKAAGPLASKHVLLVDDVFTTGATLYSCYLALRRHYGNNLRISVVTLACVGM